MLFKVLRRKLAILLYLLIPTVPLSAEPESWTLDRLMDALSAVDQRQSRFTETRELSLLQQELTTEGTLAFQRPDTLIKQYDPPDDLRYEIKASRLLIRRPGSRDEIVRLDNAPQLLAYVAAMRAVLAGDLEGLRHYFELHLDGGKQAWRLTLIPKSSVLSRQVRQIEITGSQSTIERYLIQEQGGDRILTRLRDAHAR